MVYVDQSFDSYRCLTEALVVPQPSHFSKVEPEPILPLGGAEYYQAETIVESPSRQQDFGQKVLGLVRHALHIVSLTYLESLRPFKFF